MPLPGFSPGGATADAAAGAGGTGDGAVGMHTILSLFAHWPPLIVYAVAAVGVAAETGTIVGLVLPGEATLLLGGFLCYAGTLRLMVAIAHFFGNASFHYVALEVPP